MLTAYCAQGRALGAEPEALVDGSAVREEYAMGAYKSAVDVDTSGAVTVAFQFGKYGVLDLNAAGSAGGSVMGVATTSALTVDMDTWEDNPDYCDAAMVADSDIARCTVVSGADVPAKIRTVTANPDYDDANAASPAKVATPTDTRKSFYPWRCAEPADATAAAGSPTGLHHGATIGAIADDAEE